MAESHILSGLVSKHAEIAGAIVDLEARALKLRADAATLAAAIKVVEPGYDLRLLRAKQTRCKNEFFRESGDASRFVLDTLRKATDALSTTEIADLAVSALKLRNPDIKALRACVLTTLSRQRVKKVVVEAGRDDAGAIKWKLAD